VTRLSEGFFSMQFWSLLNNGCLRKAKAMPESAATKASMKCSPRNLAGLLEFAIGRDRPTDRSSLASALGDPGLKEPGWPALVRWCRPHRSEDEKPTLRLP
jgi:hypothetical protein